MWFLKCYYFFSLTLFNWKVSSRHSILSVLNLSMTTLVSNLLFKIMEKSRVVFFFFHPYLAPAGFFKKCNSYSKGRLCSQHSLHRFAKRIADALLSFSWCFSINSERWTIYHHDHSTSLTNRHHWNGYENDRVLCRISYSRMILVLFWIPSKVKLSSSKHTKSHP